MRLKSLLALLRALVDPTEIRHARKFVRRRLVEQQQPVYLDYPVDPEPRYGHGKPPHTELLAIAEASRTPSLELIASFDEFAENLAAIPVEESADDTEPFWNNTYLGGLNAAALYCLPALRSSRLYLEIGSGNSTKFVRRSITDNRLQTRITSIDPHPRAEIDRLCDRVIRKPLEAVDPGIFEELVDGDVLMLDGSHRCFQNSDVSVFFLEIMPRLPRGVLVYIDDIYLPYDYPPEWADRFYSEQYLLAAMLMADGGRRYRVVLPHVFVERDQELRAAMDSFWRRVGLDRGSGNGIWIEIH